MKVTPMAVAGLVGALSLGGGLSGCSGLGGGGSPRVVSRGTEGGTLGIDLPTRYFTARDGNSADFYLTDLPPDVWNAGADASNAQGVIVHVHMFMNPKAGRTPISPSASSSIVRVMVLSGGEIGVYGGGAFFARDGGTGKPRLTGKISSGTLRLTSATPGFVDRLGQSVAGGSFTCARDDRQAMLLSRAMTALAGYTTPVTTEPLVDVAPAPTN